MKAAVALALAFVGLISPVFAQSQPEAIALLERMASAAQRLNYTGTFIYQSGSLSETSRISHAVIGNTERERLEVLDGTPREVERENDEVRCILPKEKVVIIEKRSVRKSFPALVSQPVSGIDDVYNVRRGERDRVAGLDAQVLMLEPRDQWRYGYRLWVEPDSGLLLKARLTNDHSEVIEQFAFTQVQVGPGALREFDKARATPRGSDWRYHDRSATETSATESGWSFRNQVAGFRKIMELRRTSRQGDRRDVAHVVFSDGIAAVSVFIEPAVEKNSKVSGSFSSKGPINLYFRMLGDHLITVLGEVPAITLKRLGDGAEPRVH